MTNLCRRHPLTKQASLLVTFAALALVSACARLPLSKPEPKQANGKQQAQESQPEMLYEWSGTGRGVSRIEIDTDAQKAVFYNGAEKIGWSMIATGIDFFSTPQGRFTVTEKVAEKRSNLYGRVYDRTGKLVTVNARVGLHRIPPEGRFEGAKMPYFMRLTKDGVGMHGGPIPEPGTPASHGCIRLPKTFAPILYEHVAIGTPVHIVGS